MRIWTMFLSLAMAALVTVNAPAGEKKHSEDSVKAYFEKQDANHDGILTLEEFVAFRPKMNADQATSFYKKLAAAGGTTTKDGVTGMTFDQFKKGIAASKPAHSKTAPAPETKKATLHDYFDKQDANHDGILTLDEFVAFRPKVGKDKATSAYNKLASLGGTTTKDGVTGMTFEQFKKAVQARKESEGKK